MVVVSIGFSLCEATGAFSALLSPYINRSANFLKLNRVQFRAILSVIVLKKDTHLPGIRVPEALAKRYEEALEYFGAQHAGFMRAMIRAVVKHAESNDNVLLPVSLRIERYLQCPHCHHRFSNVDASEAPHKMTSQTDKKP
jgi:hypothetical protein